MGYKWDDDVRHVRRTLRKMLKEDYSKDATRTALETVIYNTERLGDGTGKDTARAVGESLNSNPPRTYGEGYDDLLVGRFVELLLHDNHFTVIDNTDVLTLLIAMAHAFSSTEYAARGIQRKGRDITAQGKFNLFRKKTEQWLSHNSVLLNDGMLGNDEWHNLFRSASHGVDLYDHTPIYTL